LALLYCISFIAMLSLHKRAGSESKLKPLAKTV